MQEIISHLDSHCTQPNGYKAYQEFLLKNRTIVYKIGWDMWCFVAYFSRKSTLTNIAPEFLIVLGDSFYASFNNPGILSVDHQTIENVRIDLDIVNLDYRLRELVGQEPANLEAMFALSSLHLHKPKDSTLVSPTEDETNRFITLLQTAIATNLTPSKNALAQFLLAFFLEPKNEKTKLLVSIFSKEPVFLALKKAAELGDSWSQFMFGNAVGIAQIHNLHLEQSTRLTWLKKAADQGNFRAQFSYAVTLDPQVRRGVLWSHDNATASRYLRMAAQQGHPFAFYCLSRYEIRLEARLDYLFKSAIQGILSARVELGDYCLNKKDMVRAIYWYQHAANYNDHEAIYKLGQAHELPGEFYNEAKAFNLYKKVIVLIKNKRFGDYPSLMPFDPRGLSQEMAAKVIYAFGRCCQNGVGISPNALTAFSLFKSAARLGSKEAQEILQSDTMQKLAQEKAASNNPEAPATNASSTPPPIKSEEGLSQKRKNWPTDDPHPSSRAKTFLDDTTVTDNVTVKEEALEQDELSYCRPY